MLPAQLARKVQKGITEEMVKMGAMVLRAVLVRKVTQALLVLPVVMVVLAPVAQ
ncbi:hypothetical protein D3C78_1950470 [compost metagenome]